MTLCDALGAVPPSGFARQGIRCVLRNQVLDRCHCSFVRSLFPIGLYGLVWLVVSLRIGVFTRW